MQLRNQVNSHSATQMRVLSAIEVVLLGFGILLVLFFVTAQVHKIVLSRGQLRRLEQLRHQPRAGRSTDRQLNTRLKVDFALWSRRRIEQYESSLAKHFDPPLAVLRLSKLGLEVPLLEGTEELTLNRGVGHIAGTGRPGAEGNIGIAGHRDGFFRVLKDINPGDPIELLTPTESEIYVVDRIVLVQPDDVSVLQPRHVPSLTLVTCYPFHYVGSAPKRYIVQASIRYSHPTEMNVMNGLGLEPTEQ